jgi:hypothetical protein
MWLIHVAAYAKKEKRESRSSSNGKRLATFGSVISSVNMPLVAN